MCGVWPDEIRAVLEHLHGATRGEVERNGRVEKSGGSGRSMGRGRRLHLGPPCQERERWIELFEAGSLDEVMRSDSTTNQDSRTATLPDRKYRRAEQSRITHKVSVRESSSEPAAFEGVGVSCRNKPRQHQFSRQKLFFPHPRHWQVVYSPFILPSLGQPRCLPEVPILFDPYPPWEPFQSSRQLLQG